MGLAAPKNRTRIGNDPQNTHWANNTSRFGHRILTSQGWTPGSSLGAKNAAHADHYTAASHSHIRVLLKEDNLGLGAKRGSEKAENFGLAGLAGVLGRLNGKEEDVKKEEERREKIEQRAYVYRKYGFMNFISGGFLVGDRIEKGLQSEPKVKIEVKSEPESETEAMKAEKKSKKRKRSKEDDEVKEGVTDEQPKLKRKKKSMNLREEAAKDADTEKTSKRKKEKKEKKEKKKSNKESIIEVETELSLANTTSSNQTSEVEQSSDKARRKAEKRARKEERKLKKALKRAAKEAARSNVTADRSSSESDEKESAPNSSTPTSMPTTGTSTPMSSASGLTFGMGNRHVARQKYIRQKKMATMDPQALKEIFMIKTPS